MKQLRKRNKTDIKPVIDEALEFSQDMAKAKNISVEFDCEDEAVVFVDKISVSTVFRNLINNAIKFTDEGGKIEVLVDKSQKEGYTSIQVRDNGIGIEDESLQKLFSLKEISFTRGTLGETGTGLGLMVVKEFVEKNNGVIEVESKVKEGSTFTIHFPTSA